MQTRELIGTAKVPGGTELTLWKRGGDYMIVMGHNELMSSRMSGSEEALANMSITRLGEKGERDGDAHLLIGGYGMGFTLRAALAALGPKGRVSVAELVPEIIDWARGPMAELAAGCLDDPRVTLVQRDVAEVIAAGVDAYDAILLDVDNGPDGIVHPGNERLYSEKGLRLAIRALRPGGVLAIWSAGPDPAFKRRLVKSGLKVDEVSVRARSNGKGPKHVIWFAAKV
jgi:spermidine synthase